MQPLRQRFNLQTAFKPQWFIKVTGSIKNEIPPPCCKRTCVSGLATKEVDLNKKIIGFWQEFSLHYIKKV